ncbi:response regulator [Hydrogenophaga sp. SNF1]|uniref:phosphorylase family protein n=1 Tax=Hydrogenophaga sp. SNF1 TaxID=3098762 RepID=UPI002ACC314C|nr:response regulator [Hydrogenophaga sp. SNF1]WQB84745.1 response regulator [Hydrogenophaga sp. SNF1]
MRVLLVDDEQHKREALLNFLASKGVERESIVVAEHAAAARVRLNESAFDVLLLDVLLPSRAGARPSGEHSVELLRQIVEDGTSTAPQFIIGITADAQGSVDYAAEFKALVTHVVHFNPGDGVWQQMLSVVLQLLKRQEQAKQANDYDVVVLDALRSPELETLLEVWPVQLGSEKLLCRNILHSTGTLELDGTTRRVACAHLSQMGPIASAHAAATLLTELRPRLLVMTGICGGFSKEVSIGDLVIADKSWDWQAGKWTEGGTLAPSVDPRDGAADLVAYARTIEKAVKVAYDRFTGHEKPVTAPRLVAGPMVTGSAVVASNDIQEVFKGQHRKMAGVDMECYGMYYAASNHAGAPVRTLCIKAVSDLADRAKTDDLQHYCSYISAAAMLEVVRLHFRDAPA